MLFFKNKNGATAVEFSLVGVPFIFMIIGIIEMALMFTAQGLLEYSTSQAARQIRIGAVQQGGGETAFSDLLCDSASVFIPCGDLQYQVVAMNNFGEAQDFPEATFDENGDLENQEFTPGGVNDVVMIRVAYRYPIKTPLMQSFLTNDSSNDRIMFSTIVLQTEPYQFVL